MADTITVNPDSTITITKTLTETMIVKKEDVERAIKDITIELAKVKARLDYQKALLAKFA